MKKKYSWEEIKNSSKTKDGILALYIYRKFAYILTYFFANIFRLSPNHITALALAHWLSSAILIWYDYRILPGFLIFLGFILDCTDGNIARLKNQASNKGKLFDIISDRIGFSSIILVLAVKVSFTYSVQHIIVLAVSLLVLMTIFDIVRSHIEKITSSNIHETGIINDFESKIKAKLKKIIPLIKWENVIIGVGADLEWTLLIIASIFPGIFIFILYILLFLVVGVIFLTMVSSLIDSLKSRKLGYFKSI